jgi:hypothetical protein
MSVCAKMCNECPFSNKSLSGWLGGYTFDDIQSFMRAEISFPCHKMVGEQIDVFKVNDKIQSGEMKLCRGYVESIIKSAKMPYMNRILIEAVKQVKADGLSEDSMPMWDFKKHHEKFGGLK